MNVEWEEVALDELADLYVAAPSEVRDVIARCVEQINTRLAIDPWTLGESRRPGRRVWFVHPPMIAFDLPPGGGVLVNHVARLKGSS